MFSTAQMTSLKGESEGPEQLDHSEIKNCERALKAIDLNKYDASKVSGNDGIIISQIESETDSPSRDENRPCYKGFSQVHHLQCNHTVFCPEAAYCGSTCRLDGQISDNTPLYCLLCVRRSLNWHAKHYNARWQDLLLPTFEMLEKEQEDREAFQPISRPSEPAYIDHYNNIVRPVNAFSIGFIRALEWQKEDHINRYIPEVCTNRLNYPSQVCRSALENFDALLRHHHTLDNVDIRLVACFAVCIAATQQKFKPDMNVALKAFGIEHYNADGELQKYITAREHIFALNATNLINRFMKKAPKELRKLKDFHQLLPVARRIYLNFKKDNETTIRLRLRDQEDALTVACIVFAGTQLNLPLTNQVVVQALKIEIDALAGEYALGKVSLYAKQKDWGLSRGGQRTEERAKIKTAQVTKDQFTAQISKAMEMLGNSEE